MEHSKQQHQHQEYRIQNLYQEKRQHQHSQQQQQSKLFISRQTYLVTQGNQIFNT